MKKRICVIIKKCKKCKKEFNSQPCENKKYCNRECYVKDAKNIAPRGEQCYNY